MRDTKKSFDIGANIGPLSKAVSTLQYGADSSESLDGSTKKFFSAVADSQTLGGVVGTKVDVMWVTGSDTKIVEVHGVYFTSDNSHSLRVVLRSSPNIPSGTLGVDYFLLPAVPLDGGSATALAYYKSAGTLTPGTEVGSVCSRYVPRNISTYTGIYNDSYIDFGTIFGKPIVLNNSNELVAVSFVGESGIVGLFPLITMIFSER